MGAHTLPSATIGLDTLNHFGVGVSDLDRSVAFYSALTGNDPEARDTWSSGDLGDAVGVDGTSTIDWAVFRLGNVNVDLLDVQEPDPPDQEYQMAGLGGLHVCFEVEDLASVYDRMEEAGIEFKGPHHEVSAEEDGAEEGVGSVVAYFDGPDGEHFELIQPSGPFRRAETVDDIEAR
jgi:catechol 2,3-dioxygenase-like lactoylglutathione lyase family enzyme